MLRAVEGQSAESIADYYNLPPEQIKQILSSPLIKQQMLEIQTRLHQPALDSIKEAAGEAVDTIKDVMKGEITSELRLKAAKSLLDYNPELQKQDTSPRELGEGIGEAIIRELARQKNKAQEPIPVESTVTIGE